MRRAAGIAALALSAMLLTACGGGPHTRESRFMRSLKPVAEPGDVVAAELAFARTAQEKGQWTAFAEFATEDAVMFVPETVNARQWLKGRANPAQAVKWQPHQVWSSCDGTLAVTKGAWQRPDGSVGYFTTVWQRQDDREQSYKWVMDQGDALATPLQEPEMIGATVADCAVRPAPVVMSGRDGNVRSEGRSADQTLYWLVDVRPDGSRSVLVKLSQNGAMENVLSEEIAAGN
jgi:hypothetical protein